MDYWRDRPTQWLLEEAFDGVSGDQFMGFFWIMQRGRLLQATGSFGADEGTLKVGAVEPQTMGKIAA